ncbi:hypothetical protein BCS42_16355 [Crenothrix sp. D3]|nr:hypothetical protein BCS42_16355 [Crenothrix sp. D3]
MKNCEEIFKQYRGDSEIGGSIYIDPMSYEYPKSIVVCYECIFNFGHNSCVLHKENGKTDDEIRQESRDVERSNYCEYFLIKNFSEDGNEDEEAREEVKEIAKKINHPTEYWRRDNIHSVMEEKDIGGIIRYNQGCYTCDFYESKPSDIDFCKFHNIEIFADERYCENYHGDNNENKILTTAALYSKGMRYIPLNDNLSLKASPNHTFSIVKSSDLSELYDIEPYLLDSVQFDSNDGFVHANYTFKTDIIDVESKSIVKAITDDEGQNEENWLNMASDDEFDKAIEMVDINQKKHGVFSGDRMNNCERCSNVKRDDSYPNGSPTGLICSLKNIFVTANAACDNFSR